MKEDRTVLEELLLTLWRVAWIGVIVAVVLGAMS